MTVAVSPTLPYAIKYRKHGRIVCLGKICRNDDGELIFGVPYKGRPFRTPSLPLPVYLHLLAAGVRWWIIRFDDQRKAYRIELARVDRVATIGTDGELTVPLRMFEACPYPEWPYAVRSVLIR
ncbi:hypothetical protein [Thermomicrobium roseum]|nr:hypothetical protein [Thermomicrobium roseum]